MGPLFTLLMQQSCNAIFRVVHEPKEHPDGWRVEISAPAEISPLQLRAFQTWSSKTSVSWREVREGGEHEQLHSAAPRSLPPAQPIYHFNTHQHISFINHKSLQVINATKPGAL